MDQIISTGRSQQQVFGLNARDRARLGQALKRIEVEPRFETGNLSAYTAGGNQTCTLVRFTDATLTTGRYSGKWFLFDVETGAVTEQPDDVWIVSLNGALSVNNFYDARLVGADGGRMVFRAEGGAAGVDKSFARLQGYASATTDSNGLITGWAADIDTDHYFDLTSTLKFLEYYAEYDIEATVGLSASGLSDGDVIEMLLAFMTGASLDGNYCGYAQKTYRSGDGGTFGAGSLTARTRWSNAIGSAHDGVAVLLYKNGSPWTSATLALQPFSMPQFTISKCAATPVLASDHYDIELTDGEDV